MAAFEEAAQLGGLHTATQGVVGELVVADAPNGKIARLRMGNDKPADGGLGLHGAVFGELDADLGEGAELVEDEDDAQVGHARIANGRAQAREGVALEFFGSCFCQTHSNCLAEKGVEGIGAFGPFGIGNGRCGSEDADSAAARGDEVAEAKRGAVRTYRLLAQKWDDDVFYNDVVALTACLDLAKHS